MDRYGYLQSQHFHSYSDGASDGSCAFESYSSGDSTHSGEFPANYHQPYSSPSSNSEVFGASHDCSFQGNYQGMSSKMMGGYILDNRPPRSTRNASVSSPSPQQVNVSVAPFLHFGPQVPWQQHDWGRTDDVPDHNNGNNSSPPRCGHFQCQQPELCQPESPFDARYRASAPSLFQPRGPPRSHLATCDDPKCELRKNGRDVVMDSVDHMRISLRDSWRRQSAVNPSELQRLQEEEPSLKRRLSQVRSMIREELAGRAAANEARGFYGPRRRERNGKKCKFCLKKKEHQDTVTHHNLFDANGDVSCPILQQYRCDVCHATGKQAHTIKYCPFNNPNTPHDVILHARYQVYVRNKQDTQSARE